jgi:signal transduction histidine kinase
MPALPPRLVARAKIALDPAMRSTPRVPVLALAGGLALYAAAAVSVAGPDGALAVPPAALAGLLAVWLNQRDGALAVGHGVIGALDQLGVGVVLSEPRTQTLLAATQAAGDLTGRPPEQLTGADGVSFLEVREHELLRARSRLRAEGREPPPRLRATVTRPGGATLPVEVASAGFRVDGHPLLISVARLAADEQAAGNTAGSERSVVMVHNPGHSLALHGPVERRAAEHEREHAELERLVSIASHDLREPLRAINGFSELLEREAGDALSERAREFLEMIKQAGRRMDDLVEGLSLYGRAGRPGPDGPREVDLGATLDAVTQSLRARIEARGAEITHDELPVVRADPAGVREVLEQLVDNAIKFNGSDRPHVHVGAAGRADGWELTVSDDGIGVPDRERDRIFEMFRRLHPRDAYPGNGVGLAVCRRIVQRQGGRIWVEDGPYGGSAFHVVMPEEAEA